MRLYLEQHPDHVVVRVDLKNAYNSGSRRRLYERLPEMAQSDARFAGYARYFLVEHCHENMIFTSTGERLFAGERGDAGCGRSGR